MKKIINLALLVITLAFFSGIETKAQIRIAFGKGRSSATVKGNTGIYGVSYVVKAKSGQILSVNLTPSRQVGVKIETTDGETVLLREDKGGAYEIGLEENGDYTIFVGSTNNQPISFTLTVKVKKLADI